MTIANDLTGEVFGRLLVLSREALNDKHGKARWVCRCSCGKSITIGAGSLRSGNAKSCGCLKLEVVQTSSLTHGASAQGKRTWDYVTWQNMLQRCNNPKNTNYKDYGGRGITVDVQWLSFERFLSDMGPRPRYHTIERVDNNKGYSKGNCMWATRQAQANNRRNNRIIAYLGVEYLTLTDLSATVGVSRTTISDRLKNGLSIEEACQHKKRR